MLQPYLQTQWIEAGIDEAGRGCYAGPVYAAAVILPTHFECALLNDSKQLTATQRNMLRPLIEAESLAYAVVAVSHTEIDQTNILRATFTAMHRCIAQLKIKPQLLLIDGNRFSKYPGIPHRCIVKGDGLYSSIAAASILAKTYRDEYMLQLHHTYPQYDWQNNKGYGTASHRAAIAQYGLCPYHRKSFNILPPAQQSMLL
jgi:ribonuclease HII